MANICNFELYLLTFVIVIFLTTQIKSVQNENKNERFHDAVVKASTIIEKNLNNAPCISIAVSVDGKQVLGKGFGIADVENNVPCSSKTIFRLGDVSSSISMMAIAKQWENGNLDLDAPIDNYLPNFTAIYKSQKVSITTRQLVTHTSGIRQYRKPQINFILHKASSWEDDYKEKEGPLEDDTLSPEMMTLDRFGEAASVLPLFQDDPLESKPGTEFRLSVYGWTLASAVLEKITGKNITKILRELFTDLGMDHTYLDQYDPIIDKRGGLYTITTEKNLKIATYVDNSHKWAQGGLLSSAEDLIQFGTHMIYCQQYYQNPSIKNTENYVQPYIKSSTLSTLWTPTNFTFDDGSQYGMGWYIYPENRNSNQQKYYVSLSRATIGSSSVLVILPTLNYSLSKPPPQAVIVAIVANLQDFPLKAMAVEIAKIFENANKF